MSAPLAIGIEVSPPPVEPYRWGLLSAATMPAAATARWEATGVHYLADGCEPGGGVWLDPCSIDPPPVDPTKTLDGGLNTISGQPFIVYDSITCGPGLTEPDARGHANARLVRHEQTLVEQQFATRELFTDDTVKPNGDTALPFDLAVGLLEQELAVRYGGVGVIHIPRRFGTYALGRASIGEETGGELRTNLGNQLVFGSGYVTGGPDGYTATATQTWLFATGPVQVWRSEIQIRTDFSTTRNIRMALAERAYVVTADCPRLAVLANVPGSP